MNIGDEKRKIVVEPLTTPVPRRDTEPAPEREPVPVAPEKEPVKVGAER